MTEHEPIEQLSAEEQEGINSVGAALDAALNGSVADRVASEDEGRQEGGTGPVLKRQGKKPQPAKRAPQNGATLETVELDAARFEKKIAQIEAKLSKTHPADVTEHVAGIIKKDIESLTRVLREKEFNTADQHVVVSIEDGQMSDFATRVQEVERVAEEILETAKREAAERNGAKKQPAGKSKEELEQERQQREAARAEKQRQLEEEKKVRDLEINKRDTAQFYDSYTEIRKVADSDQANNLEELRLVSTDCAKILANIDKQKLLRKNSNTELTKPDKKKLTLELSDYLQKINERRFVVAESMLRSTEGEVANLGDKTAVGPLLSKIDILEKEFSSLPKGNRREHLEEEVRTLAREIRAIPTKERKKRADTQEKREKAKREIEASVTHLVDLHALTDEELEEKLVDQDPKKIFSTVHIEAEQRRLANVLAFLEDPENSIEIVYRDSANTDQDAPSNTEKIAEVVAELKKLDERLTLIKRKITESEPKFDTCRNFDELHLRADTVLSTKVRGTKTVTPEAERVLELIESFKGKSDKDWVDLIQSGETIQNISSEIPEANGLRATFVKIFEAKHALIKDKLEKENTAEKEKEERQKEEAVKAKRKPFNGIRAEKLDLVQLESMSIDDMLNAHGFTDFLAQKEELYGGNFAERISEGVSDVSFTEELRDQFALYINAKELCIHVKKVFKAEFAENFKDTLKLDASAYDSITDYVAELAYQGKAYEVEHLLEQVRLSEELPKEAARLEESLKEKYEAVGGEDALQQAREMRAEEAEKLETLRGQTGARKAELVQDLIWNGTVKPGKIDTLYLKVGSEAVQNKYLDEAVSKNNYSLHKYANLMQVVGGAIELANDGLLSIDDAYVEKLLQTGVHLRDDEEALLRESIPSNFLPSSVATERTRVWELKRKKVEVLQTLYDRATAQVARIESENTEIEAVRNQKKASFVARLKIVNELIQDGRIDNKPKRMQGDYSWPWSRFTGAKSLMRLAEKRISDDLKEGESHIADIENGISSVKVKKEEIDSKLAYMRYSIFENLAPAKDIKAKIQEAIRKKITTPGTEKAGFESATRKQELFDKLLSLRRNTSGYEESEDGSDEEMRLQIDAEIQEGIEGKIQVAFDSIKTSNEPFKQLEGTILGWMKEITDDTVQFGTKSGRDIKEEIIEKIRSRYEKTPTSDPRKLLIANLLRKINLVA